MAWFAHLVGSQCWLMPVLCSIILTGKQWYVEVSWPALIALNCRSCMFPFTCGVSTLRLTLVGSFDLQQHHLITSIAGRRVLVSFDGAEQRSFMQMPLQMNAQAIFCCCYLFAFFDSCENTQRHAERRESEEARTPPAFYFLGVFSKGVDWRGRFLEEMCKWSLGCGVSARRGSARSPHLVAAALCGNDRAVFAQLVGTILMLDRRSWVAGVAA